MTRFISTEMHAAFDDFGIGLLIAVPLLWIDESGVAVWLPLALGGAMLVQSLLTDYEFSLVNVIPMPVHLLLDGVSGLLLTASPWIFGFHETIWMPHLIAGLVGIGGSTTTELHRRKSSGGRQPQTHKMFQC